MFPQKQIFLHFVNDLKSKLINTEWEAEFNKYSIDL